MDEDLQITSSRSILIPESPESPNILRALPGTGNQWPENQLSDTFTERDVSHGGDIQSVSSRGNTPNQNAMRASQSNDYDEGRWYQSRRYQPSVRFVDMFDDNGGIGEFKKTLQLRIQPGAEPVVRPPRRVPNALLNRLADKLEALVKHKVIAKVEHPKNFIGQASAQDDSNQSEPTGTIEPWRPTSDSYDDKSQQGSVISDDVIIIEEPRYAELVNEAPRNPNIVTEEPRNTDIVNEEPRNIDIVNDEPRITAIVNEESKDAGDVVDEEPPAKVRKLNSSIEDDGATCPICLDMWANSGEHRIVSLKCGHLFGAQCVERWLRAQSVKDRNCPTCKSKAALKDIRFIYARNLVAADTTQATALQKQLDILQAEKNRSELELEKSRIAHRACTLQLEDLRKTLLKSQVREQPQRRSWRFALEKNLEINKDGGCRVLTYNWRTYELYVTQKSTNNLFPGFGIRKVSCVDYRLGQFLHLHPKPIRDITYSQQRDLLLSVGLDTTARIVERGILSHTIPCKMPLWSCSWDYLRTNEFYVGGVGGVIHQYDVRNPVTHMQKLNIAGDLSPVVSLVSTEHGLLSCQLNSCWLWMPNMRQWERKSLPVEGPFMSLCYDDESHRVLVSGRASGYERARLSLCTLKSASGSASASDVVIDYAQTFPGSTRTSLMCKSAFVKAPGAKWIAAHSESESSLYLHGLEGARRMCLPASEPAVDVCAARVDADTLVAALSDSRLRLYRAVPTC